MKVSITYDDTLYQLVPVEPTQGVFVPLEMLKRWLQTMEADWHKIDGEWGPTSGGLESALRLGEYAEISELREMVNKAALSAAPTPPAQQAERVPMTDEYQRGYMAGYEQRDAEVKGAIT